MCSNNKVDISRLSNIDTSKQYVSADKQVEIHHRPEGNAPTKSKNMFCPYCGVWTSLTYKKLDCCSISIMDFHVKKENKLFPSRGKK